MQDSREMKSAAQSVKQCTVGVLGYLYHGNSFIVGLSARAAGLQSLTASMARIKGENKLIFDDMFFSIEMNVGNTLPIEDSVHDNNGSTYSLSEIENMASAWIGEQIKSGSGNRTNEIDVAEGRVSLRYRAPTVKEKSRGPTGDVEKANLEIWVRPNGSEKPTQIINLHVTKARL